MGVGGLRPSDGGCSTASVAATAGLAGWYIVLHWLAAICAPSHGTAGNALPAAGLQPMFDSVQMGGKAGITVWNSGEHTMHTHPTLSKSVRQRSASKLRMALAYVALWILTSLVASAFIAGWTDLQ